LHILVCASYQVVAGPDHGNIHLAHLQLQSPELSRSRDQMRYCTETSMATEDDSSFKSMVVSLLHYFLRVSYLSICHGLMVRF
jgi:hypothetical protein